MTHFVRFSGSFALLGLLSGAGACSPPEGAPGVAALPAGEITVAIEPSVRRRRGRAGSRVRSIA